MIRGDRLALAVIVALGVIFGLGWALIGARPVDAWMYWTTDLGDLYGPWGDYLYVYPPPLAMFVALIRPLGWPLVIGVWTFVLFAATGWAGRRYALVLVLIGLVLWPLVSFSHPLRFPFMWPLIGNVGALLPALVVLGLRWPAAWSLVAVTKVMPFIGAFWFALRGEWRSFGIAVGASLAIVGVTFVIAPQLWADWIGFALSTSEADSPIPVVPVPFPVRLAMSVTLLWWGARTDRQWVVPIAAGWAAQGLYEWSWLVWIPAALVLYERQQGHEEAADDEGERSRGRDADHARAAGGVERQHEGPAVVSRLSIQPFGVDRRNVQD